MENSFYYFFSAVPQVLGGVLALFGVFVVFKVQSLKSQLLGIGNAVIIKAKTLNSVSQIVDGAWKSITISEIQSYVEKNDVEGLGDIIKSLSNVQFSVFRDNYLIIHSFLKSLITKTINASIYTATIVLIALTLIPFGTFFLNHKVLLYILFFAMLIAIGRCFYLFIDILKLSLNSTK